MKCRNCGKDIDELEMYCEECKEKLRNENDETETSLDKTKILEDLSGLSEELNEQKEENLSITRIAKLEDRRNHESKKGIIIVFSIVCALLVSVIVVLLLQLNNKPKPVEVEEEKKPNYELIISEYGKYLENLVKDYLKDNNELPNWQQITEISKYNKHEISCNIHNFYSDGNIYLNICTIDEVKIDYGYGELKEEQKEGKKIAVYKLNYNDEYYIYTDQNDSGNNLVGEITCKTDNCSFVVAYDKYVIIKEDGNYLYDYENDTLEFGPFTLDEDYSFENVLLDNNTLYGIYYKDGDSNSLYNVNTGKVIKNLVGTLYSQNYYSQASIFYKYNYVILVNNELNNFINLKTGNVSYTIDGNFGYFIEDKNKKLIYMTVYSKAEPSKFRIYNSNGKCLFDSEKFTSFKLVNSNLVVSTEKVFKVYDSKLNLKLTSKNYDKVLSIYDDFVAVIDNGYLEIVGLDDNVIATFDLKWDSDRYYFHGMLSGWYTENGKNGIYLVVEDKTILYGTEGSGLEYYYIPTTKEVGVIKTIGVGGYAKPVLYLYPTTETNVTVTFEKKDVLTTTYPKFKDKWEVVAHPNGDLYDLNNNYYYALYWEEEGNHYVDFKEGFYVEKGNAIDFLEEKLSIIGLNDKERNEFIMYWLPILEKNGKSVVYFELTDERDYYNKLIIYPKADSILRVAIHVKKVDSNPNIMEEKLTGFDRHGFTAVEWGGVLY